MIINCSWRVFLVFELPAPRQLAPTNYPDHQTFPMVLIIHHPCIFQKQRGYRGHWKTNYPETQVVVMERSPYCTTFRAITSQSTTFRDITDHSITFRVITSQSTIFCVITGHSITFRVITSQSTTFRAITGHSITFRAITSQSTIFHVITSHSVTFRAITSQSITFPAVPTIILHLVPWQLYCYHDRLY